MRPRAIPLAMLTIKNETHGFHNFYAWFSSVSLISIGMGLRSGGPSGRRSSAISNFKSSYYSTIAPFYHIWSRERAMLCSVPV